MSEIKEVKEEREVEVKEEREVEVKVFEGQILVQIGDSR